MRQKKTHNLYSQAFYCNEKKEEKNCNILNICVLRVFFIFDLGGTNVIHKNIMMCTIQLGDNNNKRYNFAVCFVCLSKGIVIILWGLNIITKVFRIVMTYRSLGYGFHHIKGFSQEEHLNKGNMFRSLKAI